MNIISLAAAGRGWTSFKRVGIDAETVLSNVSDIEFAGVNASPCFDDAGVKARHDLGDKCVRQL